jgi:hypothetical protein
VYSDLGAKLSKAEGDCFVKFILSSIEGLAMTHDVERRQEADACPEPFGELKINSSKDGNLPLPY